MWSPVTHEKDSDWLAANSVIWVLLVYTNTRSVVGLPLMQHEGEFLLLLLLLDRFCLHLLLSPNPCVLSICIGCELSNYVSEWLFILLLPDYV